MSSVVVFVPPNLDFSQRTEVGLRLIRYIRSRAKRGRGAGNAPMGGPDGDNKYSKNYEKTSDFKAAGKTKGRVNMTLSGDLLDDLVILDASIAGRIEIGPEDNENKRKVGYLRDKNYNFLQLTQAEVDRFVQQVDNSSVNTLSIGITAANEILRRIIGN